MALVRVLKHAVIFVVVVVAAVRFLGRDVTGSCGKLKELSSAGQRFTENEREPQCLG